MIASVKSAKKDELGASKAAVPLVTVPPAEGSIQGQYAKFAKCSDPSVVFTVHDDLRVENEKEKSARLQFEEQQAIKGKESQQKIETKMIQQMLQLYFYPPPDPREVLRSSVKAPPKVEPADSKEDGAKTKQELIAQKRKA